MDGATIFGLADSLKAAAMPGDPPFSIDPLLILAVVLVVGTAGGLLARKFHVPSITGNIIAGAILGLTLFRSIDVAAALEPLSAFAVALIAVTAGGHFSYRRMHNALKRILLISVLQVAGAIVVCYVVLVSLGMDSSMALLLGVLATSSSPATIVAVTREVRAKGPAVKTLLASVSMDSGLCIVLFAVVESLLLAEISADHVADHGLAAGLRQSMWHLFGSGLLSAALGILTTRMTRQRRFHGLSFMFVAVLLAAGISTYLEVSPLLTALFYGAILANTTRRNEAQLEALHPIEPLLYTAFFTVAGVSLHFDMLMEGGVLFVAYVLARIVGKGLGAYVGAAISKSSPRIRKSLPFAFVPQAGVALGLVIVLQSESQIPEEFSSIIVTLVLASITVNEIIGPSVTRWSLFRAEEAGLDRPRLVEFLQEEFVLVGLEARDRWDAIEKLVDFYALTHRVSNRERNKILETVKRREEEHTTAIGLESALPHGWVESGPAIGGVLATAPDGIEWDAPDGEPVKLIVLIVTPQDQENRHLDVLASLSIMVRNDRLRTRLASATDANDAWEALESKELRDLNYFLDDDSEDSPGKGTSSAG